MIVIVIISFANFVSKTTHQIMNKIYPAATFSKFFHRSFQPHFQTKVYDTLDICWELGPQSPNRHDASASGVKLEFAPKMGDKHNRLL